MVMPFEMMEQPAFSIFQTNKKFVKKSQDKDTYVWVLVTETLHRVWACAVSS